LWKSRRSALAFNLYEWQEGEGDTGQASCYCTVTHDVTEDNAFSVTIKVLAWRTWRADSLVTFSFSLHFFHCKRREKNGRRFEKLLVERFIINLVLEKFTST
jgi:hypothetical protein